jgi:hypothetical protein
LLEDEQTSKHGGGGKYDAILEFKGKQIRNVMRKKERKKERKRNMRKRKRNISMCKNKKSSELSGSLKCIRNFKASRLKDPYSLSNHVQSDNEDLLCASRSCFAICTCPLISSVCIFLFPLLDITLFSNDLFDESR